MRIAPRLVAPLIACGIAFGAAVIGGACVLPTAANPPKLDSGIYVLTRANGQSPPGTFVDSNRTVRVFADTFNLNASTLYFDEHASAAITPRGGTEQPVSLIVIAHQPYTIPQAAVVHFLVTLYGVSITATVQSATSFDLQLPDHSQWHYDKR